MLWLQKIWYPRSFLTANKTTFWLKIIFVFLLPLSCLYGLVMLLRRYCYRLGIFNSHKLAVPVMVVGNLTVGGTGKTPYVIYLAQQLVAKGKHPGIICRGYKGQASEWPQCVSAVTDPNLVGDEAVLLAQKTQLPVCAGANRVKSAQKLIDEKQCDIIISDDGLAHYALARDVEIIIIDGERQFGNGWLLPAGPLRETKSRLKNVNQVLVNGKDFILKPTQIFKLNEPQRIIAASELQHKTVHAVCAIGNPQRFFNTLRELNIEFIPHVYPDHYTFSQADMDFNDIVIMTEKDAVKCQAFADDRHVCVRVDVEMI